MVDQVRELENRLRNHEAREKRLENALHAIRELGHRAANSQHPHSHSFAVGRMFTLAEFALDPTSLEEDRG